MIPPELWMTKHPSISPGFVKAIHIQLPDKTVYPFMPEMPREDYLLELVHVADCKLQAISGPVDYLVVDWQLCIL